MQKKFHIILCLLAAVLTGCDEDLSSGVRKVNVCATVRMPADVEIERIADAVCTFTNRASGAATEAVPGAGTPLVPGLYDVSYHATATLAGGATATLRALSESVVITGDTRLRLSAFCIVATDDLIISEVFFAGTLRPGGAQYTGDGYIKLYNNTGHTVYADGLTIFETKFLTTEKRDLTPDIMAEAVTVQALYTIPGQGTDHPVAPGEELLICDAGIDHRTANPNSFSLAHADFEWYDASATPSVIDIDSPDVPNLEKWYCYTKSVWVLHNRGFKAWGIARIPVGRDTYLADYKYSYGYETVTAAGAFPMTGEAYRLPNGWIVDIVTCSVASDYAWQLSVPALDSGWTSCGTTGNDRSRYFHSVRRKLAGFSSTGQPLLQDTNNSTADFNACVVPSETELQHSAVDASGTPCTLLTYDGVTPAGGNHSAR